MIEVTISSNSEQNMATLMAMLSWMDICASSSKEVEFEVSMESDPSSKINFYFGDKQEKYEKAKQAMAASAEKHGGIAEFVFE